MTGGSGSPTLLHQHAPATSSQYAAAIAAAAIGSNFTPTPSHGPGGVPHGRAPTGPYSWANSLRNEAKPRGTVGSSGRTLAGTGRGGGGIGGRALRSSTFQLNLSTFRYISWDVCVFSVETVRHTPAQVDMKSGRV